MKHDKVPAIRSPAFFATCREADRLMKLLNIGQDLPRRLLDRTCVRIHHIADRRGRVRQSCNRHTG